MLYAYFGGTGASNGARYEVLLLQDKTRYTVVAEHYGERVPNITPHRTWFPYKHSPQPSRCDVTRLYHGRDALTALRIMLRAAHVAANSAQLGQRYCYLLPTVSVGNGGLAPLIPAQLRHNNALPEHPQLWQVGRSLAHLPRERHADACRDQRVFGDERITWAWVRA